LCPEVALETLRFLSDLAYPFEHEKLRLNTLIPPSDPRRMHFPVFSAYDKTSRRLFVAANQVPGLLNTTLLFTQLLANDLSNVTVAASSNFTYPSNLASIEAVNGTLFAIFQNGNVVTVNPQTGATTAFASLLPVGGGP
jgi:hypothetical protein